MKEPTIPAEDRASPENPWPGLRSYEEDEERFFHGRAREIDELLRLVRRDALTVCFGISGIGKSSLLKAGLSPRLREHGMLPVRIRLSLSDQQLDLGRDVVRAFEKEVDRAKLSLDRAHLDAANASAAPDDRAETLWEYFHGVQVWDHADRLTPILVIDQFEEVFTLGTTPRAATQVAAFLTELADLVENQLPVTVRRRIEETRQPPPFRTDDQPYGVVLALREDYLADLEGLVVQMPSLSKRNRFRLLPMTNKQALDAVIGPGAAIVREPVARQIVDAVSFTRGAGSAAVANRQADAGEVEPFLLSLVCRELNEQRQKLGQTEISHDLVQSSEQGVGNILRTFYQRSFAGLPSAASTFVEDQLVGRTGYRQMIAVDDLRDAPDIREAVRTLVTRRLLRIEEDRHGVERVELSHDVLTPVALESRNRRLVKDEAARAWEKQKAERRRWAVGILAIGLLMAVSLSVVAWRQRQVAIEQTIQADEERAKAIAALAVAQAALEAKESAQKAASYFSEALKEVEETKRAEAAPISQKALELQARGQTELAASNRVEAPAPTAAPVRPIAPRAYIQVRSNRDAEWARRTFFPQLSKAGFVVPTPEIVASGPGATEVRYFRHDERDGAEHIARVLRDAGVPAVQVKYVAGYEDSRRMRPNHFEVWLAPQGQ